MENTPTFSQKLRKAIDECGLSPSVLARAIGVSPPTITRFMHDDRSISMEIVDKIFMVLGLDVVQGTPPQDLTIFAKPLGRPPKPKLNPHDGDPDISKHKL